MSALEHSAALVEHRAERHQRNGRSADAADEGERVRRAHLIVAQARSMLR